jgi:uncharacterized membrane protein YgcG
MKRLLLVATIAATAILFPASAPAAQSFTGTVVGTGHGSLAVAGKGGSIKTVHTGTHARVGNRVRITGASVRVIGFTRHVRIHAVIVRRSGSTTFLAGGHSLFSVHTHGRALASVVVTNQPTTGAVINTTATVASNGQLIAGPTQVVGEDNEIEVEAMITAVGNGTITLSVNGQSLTLSLPAGIQLPQSLVGKFVELKLELEGAQPVANEDNDDQADNNDQGDDNDDQGDNNHDGDDRGGGGGGSGGGGGDGGH